MSPSEDNTSRPSASGRSTRRQLAEWVTMSLGAIIVAGVALYLLYQAVSGQDEAFIAAEVRPLYEQVRLKDDRYILPVEVVNRGGRTVRDFTGQLSYPGPGGEPETREFAIDYLGERATATVYFFFDQPPRSLSLEVKPLYYRLE